MSLLEDVLKCFANGLLMFFLIVYRPEAKPERDSSSDSKPDMPPPPSPASSTCSDHSGPVLVSRSKC